MLFHSDRSSQYASRAVRDLLAEYGMQASMSRKGNCWDTQFKIQPERRPDLTRAGIARVLHGHEIEVLEVNHPDRAARRSRGKSDPTDAENAARAVLSGRTNAIAKEQSGAAEAMRAALVARRSAVKARTQASNPLRALLVSAPQDIRERLLKTNTDECIALCARLRSLGATPLLSTLTVNRPGNRGGSNP